MNRRTKPIALTEVGVVGEIERRTWRQVGGGHPSSLTHVANVNTLKLYAQQLEIAQAMLDIH